MTEATTPYLRPSTTMPSSTSFAAGDQHGLGALGGEVLGDGLADAGAGTGDDGDTVFKLFHGRLSRRWRSSRSGTLGEAILVNLDHGRGRQKPTQCNAPCAGCSCGRAKTVARASWPAFARA